MMVTDESSIRTNGLKRRIIQQTDMEQSSRSSKVSLKQSQSMDIETGKAGSRTWLVEEVNRYKEAMKPSDRRRKEFFNMFRIGNFDVIDTASTILPPQYRLKTSKRYGKFNCVERITRFLSGDDESPTTESANAIPRFLNWTFRTTFAVLILVQAIFFWFFTTVWAVVIMGVGRLNPSCITVGEKYYDDHFLDAFALSWTTFSTVGYGLVYPTLSVVKGPNCIGINAMMSIEAFMGVLFAAVMGALVFGKVCRIQSHATVAFSDPIIVRYGTGVSDTADEGDDDDNKSIDTGDLTKRLPCPVLEFRIINTMHNTAGGEIMNAFINCTSNINASNATFGLHKSQRRRVKGSSTKVTKKRPKNKVPSTLNPPHEAVSSIVRAVLDDALNPYAADTTQIVTGSLSEIGATNTVPRHSDDDEDCRESAPQRAKLGSECITALKRDTIDEMLKKLREKSTGSPRLHKVKTPTSSKIGNHAHVDKEHDSFDSELEGQMPRQLPLISHAIIKSRNTKHNVKSLFRSAAETVAERGGSAVQAVVNHVSSNVFSPNLGSHGYDPDDDGDIGEYSENHDRPQRHTVVDEGSGLVKPRFFAPLDLETPTHPFFKRVWVVRHTLNENSPLLSGFARTLISENNGYWPVELNSHEKVRENIDFHELIISFSGTANATGSAVYQQTIYKLSDLAVGYTFANLLITNTDGVLRVAEDLISDVVEQRGGGGEPLGEEQPDRGILGALEAFGDVVGNTLDATTTYIGLKSCNHSDSEYETSDDGCQPLPTGGKSSGPAFAITTRGDDGLSKSLFGRKVSIAKKKAVSEDNSFHLDLSLSRTSKTEEPNY